MADSETPHGKGSEPLPDLLNRLATAAGGLDRIEAIRRARLQAPIGGRRRPAWARLLDQFRSPIILLLPASALPIFGPGWFEAAASGEPFSPADAPDGLIILFILRASGVLGFWQERSAAGRCRTRRCGGIPCG